MNNNQHAITPYFKTIPIQNEALTKEHGRPIFEDKEFVEIRIAGDRYFAPCFPAHQFWTRMEGTSYTYAERWSDEYKRFREGQVQTASGTPLSEAPFLTEAKRAELRALKIYSVEALAGLEGKNLATLGMGGQSLKQQAKAYLENATGSAAILRLAQQNEELKARIAEIEAVTKIGVPPAEIPGEPVMTDYWETLSNDELKEQIKAITGEGMRGNPSRETLLNRVRELSTETEPA